MKLLINAIEKEQQRILTMIELYKRQLLSLKKGVIVQKKVRNNQYYYLQYREGIKIVTKYIGKNEEKVKEISEQIEKRKHIEVILNMLEKELIKTDKFMEELK